MLPKKLTILISFTFAFVAVFGFLCLGLSEHVAEHPCPIHATGSSDHTMTGNSIAHTLHHLFVLQSDVSAILVASLLMLLFSFLILTAFRGHETTGPPRRGVFENIWHQKLFSPIRESLFWSALHNKHGMTPSVAVSY